MANSCCPLWAVMYVTIGVVTSSGAMESILRHSLELWSGREAGGRGRAERNRGERRVFHTFAGQEAKPRKKMPQEGRQGIAILAPMDGETARKIRRLSRLRW
jgi:hypothetical protein